MTGIFNATIFNNTVFNTGSAAPIVVEEPVKTGTGGIDPYGVYKPTGFTKRNKLKLKKHDERIEEFKDAQIEIAARLAREFTTEVPTSRPVSQMSMLDVDREIGMLLREKVRIEEDEMLLLLLIAAAG